MSILLAAAAAACIAFPAAAQPIQAPGRIPTVTRLVKVFYDLESRLVANLVARDAKAIDQALDPDFELRAGSVPGTPVPRADWIRQAQVNPSQASIDQMAVHDFGSVAVVSFRLVPAATPVAAAAQALFIVDCWKRDGDGWKLATRYLSNAAAPASAIPASAGTIDKRY
ncbi:MAG TPA: nuclear transport factor 2 family protein [Casimicrobiaceae bacterium]|nr:nuclear transport factor 2 family protein [Casimicrobiaceae bacterium]